MAEPITFDEAMGFISRLFDQSDTPKTSPNAVRINCVSIVTRVDLSALPPGTLIDSYVTGEFFKVAYDHWVSTRQPDVRHTDTDVANQVRLGWDADLERSDFNLIHVGE